MMSKKSPFPFSPSVISASTTIPKSNKIKVAEQPIIIPKIAKQLAAGKTTDRRSKILDIRTSLLKTGKINDVQVDELMALKYRNKNEYILSPTDPQIFKEIRAMVEYQEFRDILDFLTDAPSRSYIMWDQEIMDEGRIAVEKEITIQRYEEIGVKGVGKCKYCTSTELIFVQKQINSGDEPMRVFVRCVACQKHWRM